jgi:hypothetical protein
VAGLITPPAAALQAQGMPSDGTHHAGGALRDPVVAPYRAQRAAIQASLPASADLSRYNPPVGAQRDVGSCVAWATGYGLRGWYAKRDGYYPSGGSGGTGSFEPMYTYAQIVRGQDVGTTFSANLNIQQQQGLDTRADYTQGDYDYTVQPTVAETVNAGNYRTATYNVVGGSSQLQTWIQSTIAGGDPIAISFPVYPEFDNVSYANALVYPPRSGEVSRGGHAVLASSYDANGLWIENSWGTGYGLNGYAELSWDFVNQYAWEGASMVPNSSNLSSRGLSAAGPSAVMAWGGASQDIFRQGTDGNLWEESYRTSDGSISGPVRRTTSGNLGSAPSAVFDATRGSENIYWQGTDGQLWEMWYTNGRWGGPAIFPNSGTLGSAPSAVMAWGGAGQDLFWRGADGNLWEESYRTSDGSISGPVRRTTNGNLGSAPSAVFDATRWSENMYWQATENIYWRGTGHLSEMWYTNGGWGGPAIFPQSASQ